MKIVVLGGGISPERQVSLETSESILEVLRQMGHKAIFVDLFLGIGKAEDCLFEAEDGLLSSLKESTRVTLEDLRNLYLSRKGAVLGPNVLEICQMADFVFLGLHGEDGEDGKFQGTLDLLGIPYNGSGLLGSAIAMNKFLTRQVMQLNDIPVPPLVENAPCVLKLVHGGSSIGLQMCETDAELETALSRIREYGDDYIIERKITGTEVSVGVLDDQALPLIEVIPPAGRFLDYEAKYSEGEKAMTVICPARISEELTAEAQRYALRIHRALHLSGYSRTDFIIDESGKIWALETNTLSGFTKSSFVPLAAERSGISFKELCSKIIDMGIERNRSQRRTIVREMAK